MNQNYKAYAGIGSRETPFDIQLQMTYFATNVAKLGWTLRSGGALRADLAFEKGAKSKEIFDLKRGFQPSTEAYTIAAMFHPAWNKCSPYAKALHARNCYQILGKDLQTPSKFVLCWTLNASGQGGTGQALRLAKHHNIPIFDMGKPIDETLLTNLVMEPNK